MENYKMEGSQFPHLSPLVSPTVSKRIISSVQSLSRIQLFMTPWTTAHQASLSITNSRSLLKLISSSVVPFCSCLQSFPPSGSFQKSQLFVSGGQILEFQLQHQSFQ